MPLGSNVENTPLSAIIRPALEHSPSELSPPIRGGVATS